MRVLLINPPYQTLTSNLGTGHQIPLGLLMVGGPLLDDGHDVRLLDAEQQRLDLASIVNAAQKFKPHVVMTGHAGSTPAHPVCMRMLRALKDACPQVVTVYGGVYPTYHASAIIESEAAVDIVVRGEGEATALELVGTLAGNDDVSQVTGITFRTSGRVMSTPDRAPATDLDAFRVGWELIEDWDRYQCFGLGRAAIVQLSRGCPHRCTYCGQFNFWVNWRHRDPVRFADEIEWLYRTYDIRFCTIADENPTTRQDIWRQFLEEMARRQLPVHFFATIRATDIVRDADILHLYREAGILYVLMGIESTDAQVLKAVRKGSTTRHDYQACQLLKQHGIYSVMGHIVGLDNDTWTGFRTALQQLKHYDGDYVNAMYVTPHSWTQFARDMAGRKVVQLDQQKWDYRHQVLAQRHLTPKQLFLAVKWLELRFHLRPRKLWTMLRTDAFHRRQLLWSLFHTGMVWCGEIADFLFATRFASEPVSLEEYQAETHTSTVTPNAPSSAVVTFDKARTLVYTSDVTPYERVSTPGR